MKFANNWFAHRGFGWVLLWAMLILFTIADVTQPKVDLLPYYWVPVFLAASFFS